MSVSVKIAYLEDPSDLDSECWCFWCRAQEAEAVALARTRAQEALQRGAKALRVIDIVGREIALEPIEA